jgi:hypothetical protein
LDGTKEKNRFFGPPTKRRAEELDHQESSVPVSSNSLESANDCISAVTSTSPFPINSVATLVPVVSSTDQSDTLKSQGAEWYKDHKLGVTWLCNSFSGIIEKVAVGKRSGLKCKVCFNQINEAKTRSRNGQVPMAHGIRSDGVKESKESLIIC